MRKSLIYIFLVSLLGTGCEKFLDREPISLSTDANFWKNESEANVAVASCYSLLRNSLLSTGGMNYYAHGDLTSDEFSNVVLMNNDYLQVNNFNLSLSVPISETGRVMQGLRRYDLFYRAIDQANRCMKFLPQVPTSGFTSVNVEAVRQRLIAEAYFIRAYTYFYLTRVWERVPLVLETIADPSVANNVPQSSQEEILAQCIKDLEYAIPLLTWTFPVANDRAVRANRASAFALLAHIHAWKGEYDKSASAADSVILKGGFNYVNRSTSYLTIFNGRSSEGIFELSQNNANEGYSSGIAFFTLEKTYLTTYPGKAQLAIDTTSFFKRFFTDTSKDLRVKTAFSNISNRAELPFCIKYSNIFYTATNTTTPSAPIARHNMIIFRLSDIKLLRAEALAATNKFSDARIILNEVRGLANLDPSTATDAQLFEAIIDERGRELFLEGHRSYDLVRLGKKTGILKFDPVSMGGSLSKMSPTEFQAKKYYWPIDPFLIYNNAFLEQSSFWRDRM